MLISALNRNYLPWFSHGLADRADGKRRRRSSAKALCDVSLDFGKSNRRRD